MKQYKHLLPETAISMFLLEARKYAKGWHYQDGETGSGGTARVITLPAGTHAITDIVLSSTGNIAVELVAYEGETAVETITLLKSGAVNIHIPYVSPYTYTTTRGDNVSVKLKITPALTINWSISVRGFDIG